MAGLTLASVHLMSSRSKPVLVVGCGFAGAVHARCLAEAGVDVVVIDKRGHVAGNAFDEVDASGVRVHRYGPHLFHTANRAVLDWINRYGEWVPYTHRVRAQLRCGSRVPMPINVETVNTVYGTRHRGAAEAQAFLDRVATPVANPANAAEALAASVGVHMRDLLFRGYSRTMWGRDLEELDAKLVARVPMRVRACDTYFKTGETQLLPKHGYTDFIGRVLAHDRISVHLSTPFDKTMLRETSHCFASMAIDEYFDHRLGPLPYRSIRFSTYRTPVDTVPGAWVDGESHGVLNFTDGGPVTRETAWHRFAGHVTRATGHLAFTRETPCDDTDNDMERYYPVPAADEAIGERYRGYAAFAAGEPRVTFIGRCGTYRYLDMDQVVSQSLASARRWLGAREDTDGSFDRADLVRPGGFRETGG